MAIWRNAWSTSNYQYTNFKKLPQQSIWDFSNVPLTSPARNNPTYSFHPPSIQILKHTYRPPHVIFCSLFLFKSWYLYHFFIYLAKLTNSPFECGGSAHEPVKEIENRFFHKSLKLYPDARAFSGEHCGSYFTPKKVWRPLSSSRQNSRKIHFLWWTMGDPWAGPPHSNGEFVNLARYMTICSCEMKIKVFISLRNIQPRFNFHI